MFYTTNPPDADRVPDRLEAGIDRITPESEDSAGGSLAETGKELLDVIDSLGALLRTIDFETLPDAIDVEELRRLVSSGSLADAIREQNPNFVVNVQTLRKVVRERELLDSVDLLEFGKAERKLNRELDDVLGEGATSDVGSDSEVVAEGKEYVSSLRNEATEQALQQEAAEKVKAAQRAVLERHAALEDVYEANKERVATAKTRASGRGPTHVSLLPRGPLPDSVSTRFSSVPSKVLHSNAEGVTRIFGRRWRDDESERDE